MILWSVIFAKNWSGIIFRFYAEPDMLKIEFTEAEIGQLYREFMAHPSVAAKKKYLLSI
jgi:hypothetical protein